MKTIKDVQEIDIVCHTAPNGSLIALESNNKIPMSIERIFTIFNVKKNDTRGKHAHLECHQFLNCVKGHCLVICDDGFTQKIFKLNSPDKGLYVPEMIWVTLEFAEENNVVNVLASQPYFEKDYIRNYNDFINLKKKP